MAKILVLIFAAAMLNFCGSGEKAIPEMEDFMKNSFGSFKKVAEGLQKYSAAGIDKKDMDIYDLKDPKIMTTEKKGNVICYTIDAKAGMTVRTYTLCWDQGKIISIDFKGMK